MQFFACCIDCSNNEYPSYHTAGAFAMGLVLVSAIEISQSLDSQVVARTLEGAHFATLYGNVSFDSSRKGDMDYLVRQVIINCC
jgi:ABC-type branched-subunit amino acid transport system substrate-binding protein